MPVQITINGDNAAQAIEEFSALSAAFIGAPAAPIQEEKPKRQRAATPSKEEKPAQVEAPEQPEETSSGDTSSDDAEDIPSAVDLRAKAQELGQDAANKPKIKALLDKYEAKNITALRDDQRAGFMRDLEALG